MEQKQEKSFVTETIKDKPVNKKKLIRRTLTTVVLAVVFGLIACLTFFLMEPVINNILNPEEITKVKFPEEAEEVKPEELLTEETVAQQEDALLNAKEETNKTVENGQGDNTSIGTYAKIYADVQKLAKESEKSLVTVISISEREDFFAGTTENENTTSGLIVAENGVELLIVADVSYLQDVMEYRVKFFDGKSVKTSIKEMDRQTGLAVFGVKMSNLPQETKEALKIATLGNSLSDSIAGTPTIAVGAPYGTSGSLSLGMITSEGKKINMVDAVYRIITTDMNMAQNASGVVLNLKGEVIGIITRNAVSEIGSGTISAIGISDVKTLIAKMSNDEKRAYIGIRGMDVTDEAHSETGVPLGVYVSEVITGSPAMEAGIQNGDVIVGIGNHSVTSFREFRAGVLSIEPQTMAEVTVLRFDGVKYNEIIIEIMTGEAE